MLTSEILIDAYGRIQEEVHTVLAHLSEEQLVWRPAKDANSIAWLIWHLSRLQDDHLAELIGAPQRYTAEDWAQKFNLPFDDSETGWGQTSQQVAQVRADSSTLRGYYDAVHAATIDYLRTLKDDDYERIVDRRWDPPVTLTVRLVSVLADDLQHVGQAAYVRGLLA